MATSHSMTNNLPQLSHPDGSPIRALVVDDEPSLSELMSMGLRMAGWSVAVAADGPAAVKLAKEFRPDVLVLDVMLPGFDGVELLGRIRAFAPEVPALFLTAKDGVQDRILGLAAGGDDGSGRRASQLHQVLVNLLSNARKHTRAGTTVVTGVSRSADGGVAVTVTDDGAGIPAEFVDRVFARFARADASRAVRVPSGEGAAAPGLAGPASAEGTNGLGLSIVQPIVEAHGGSVGVTSRPGRTRYTVPLPATTTAQGDAPHP